MYRGNLLNGIEDPIGAHTQGPVPLVFSSVHIPARRV